MIKIANCSKLSVAEKSAPNFVYIGRRFAGFEASPLCNPFKGAPGRKTLRNFLNFSGIKSLGRHNLTPRSENSLEFSSWKTNMERSFLGAGATLSLVMGQS